MMGTRSPLNGNSTAGIIRAAREQRTLREFAAELGNCTGEAVRLWELGNDIKQDTLIAWWNDDREWVRNLARDILVLRFKGIRERFIQDTA